MSTSRPSTSIEICPSCGRRRSTMFIPPRILTRLTIAGPMEPGRSSTSLERAVDAVPDPDPVARRLDVDVGRPVAQALRDDHLHHADDRRLLVDLGGLELLGLAAQAVTRLERLDLAADLAGRLVRGVQRPVEVAVGRDRGDHRPADRRRDRGDVLGRRVEHRHQDAVVGEPDGEGPQPARRRRRGAGPSPRAPARCAGSRSRRRRSARPACVASSSSVSTPARISFSARVPAVPASRAVSIR